MTKVNPKKLNKLQLRTLVLCQVIARDDNKVTRHEDGSVTIWSIPQPHGDHVHVGKFVVSTKDASGFSNEAVWSALERKGLVKDKYHPPLVLTLEGATYVTGLDERFMQESDH